MNVNNRKHNISFFWGGRLRGTRKLEILCQIITLKASVVLSSSKRV